MVHLVEVFGDEKLLQFEQTNRNNFKSNNSSNPLKPDSTNKI